MTPADEPTPDNTTFAVIHLLRRQSRNPIRKPATAAALSRLADMVEQRVVEL